MNKIYRGKGGKFASKAEIAAQKAAEAIQGELAPTPRESLQAFKGFNNNAEGKLQCRHEIFEVGKENTLPAHAMLSMCEIGYHACVNPFDVFRYYPINGENRFAKITLLDEIIKRSKYHDADKSVGRTIRVDEEVNIHHLVNLLAKYARENPDNKPYKGKVILNKLEATDAMFNIVTDRYHVYTQIGYKSGQLQLNNTFSTKMIAAEQNMQQVATGDNMNLIAVAPNVHQISYGRSVQHIMSDSGSILVLGQNSNIQMMKPGVKFKGPGGTRFSIAESTDSSGMKIPGISGVIGQPEFPANKWLSYSYRREYSYKFELKVY